MDTEIVYRKNSLGRRDSGAKTFVNGWLPKQKEPRSPRRPKSLDVQPIREEPITKNPIKDEPITKIPVKEEPITKIPVKEEPITKIPIKEEQKVTKIPIKEKLIAKIPFKAKPIAKIPINDESIAKKIADEPIQKENMAEKNPKEADTSLSEANEKVDVDDGGGGLDKILEELQTEGSRLWKIRSSSVKSQKKFILDHTVSSSIRYEPTGQKTSGGGCLGKTKKEKQVDLNEICDIRSGWKTDVFNALGTREEKRRRSSRRLPFKKGEEVNESTCFSIIYGPQRDTLDLMAPNEKVAEKWVQALQHLVSTRQKQKQSNAHEQSYEQWLRKQFNAADVDKNKCLSFRETLKLLKRLNISMEVGDAKILFDEANSRKEDTRDGKRETVEVLDEDEFITFYFKLLKRPEIDAIISKYSKNSNGTMSADDLLKFLQENQHQSSSIDVPKMGTTEGVEDAKKLIQKFEPTAQLKLDGQLGVAGLTNLLLSPEMDIFNMSHRTIYQDMTQPLANYFIAASHNTYLIGNQLTGKSSVEGYIDALQRGCRCVELDCWDGDDDEDEEPIIYHGHTLTSKIYFKEVLSDAIVPYAFAKTPYPLILNVENHCSPPYQQKMVDHLKTILGAMLYTENFDPDMTQLPSPEELEGKIIVRGKGSAASTKNATDKNRSDSTEAKNFTKSGSIRSKVSTDSSNDSDDSDDNSVNENDKKQENKKEPANHPLSTVLNILQGSHFTSFIDAKVHGRPFKTVSIAESKALKMVDEQKQDFVDFNKKQITRIYPAGTRTGSSNFNPIPFWTAGCQLVALNYQTEDTPNFYNYVQFTENGGCGYVLKPKILLNPAKNLVANVNQIDDNSSGRILKLKIISGQNLPKAPGESEIIDPYVKIKVTGLPQDKSKFVTKVVSNNGFNPMWDEEWETLVTCPELAFLVFKVYDYARTGTDVQLAHYGLPFSALASGYRQVHLVSKRGTSLAPASLFVHVRLSKMESSI